METQAHRDSHGETGIGFQEGQRPMKAASELRSKRDPATDRFAMSKSVKESIRQDASALNRQETCKIPVVCAGRRGITPAHSAARPAKASSFSLILLGLWLVLVTVSMRGQTVTTTVPAGPLPQAVAANPVTNKIYVASGPQPTDQAGNLGNITVIDGATNSTTTVTDPNANDPSAVAVNPVTNKIYVANFSSNNVTVIDGSTNLTTTVMDPNAIAPAAVAVNTLTNKIYVANRGNGTTNLGNVTVIDGATNLTTTVTDPNAIAPSAVAVNPVTNKIYVANGGNGTTNLGNVTVIDGATNLTTTVMDPHAIAPAAVAVNSVTNKIYVANGGNGTTNLGNVTVIDGDTNLTTTVTDPNGIPYPAAVAVNPVTNLVYVANEGVDDGTNGDVTVINGATNIAISVTIPTAGAADYPVSVAVNPVANKIYVANEFSNDVTVIDGATNLTTTIADPNASEPIAVGVNPVTNKIYVANFGSSNVTVIDGDANTVATVGAGTGPRAVAANPATNTIYVANYESGDVTVIDGATNTVTATVAAGTGPYAVAVNPVTNTIYVSNFVSNNVTVIDGVTNSTTTVTDPNAINPQAVAVNPVTNKIYVTNNGSSNVTAIDGATNTVVTPTIPAGTTPEAVAVNPVTGKIYVANLGSDNVTVIDGATDTVTATVSAGSNPLPVAVNSATNMIYVGNTESSNVTVIDGSTDTVTATVPAGTSPFAVAVNPVTNIIYVVNNSSYNVTVIDGANPTSTPATVNDPNAIQPYAVAVDPVTNHVYVTNQGNGDTNLGNVTVIDGATNTFSTVTDPNANQPLVLAVNPVTNLVYVNNYASKNVTVIAQQQVQAIPIQTTITPLAGNQTDSLATTFSFTATNSLTTAPIDNLMFQVDTWQAPWLVGTSQGGGNFTGTTPTLQPGFHILYAYSTDGEEATSTNTGRQSSPLIGNITVYGFLVAAPEAGLSPSTVPFGKQAVGTVSAAQPVTLTNIGTAPLNITSIGFSGPNANDFSQTNGCDSSLAAGTNCTINVTFTPSAAISESATLVLTDNSGDVAGNQQTVSLTGTGVSATATTTVNSSANPSVFAQSVTFTAAVTPQGSGTPTGTVNFNDGTTPICKAVPLSSGRASCTISTLAVGRHSVTAVYSGDSNFLGSTSPVLSQTVNPAATTTRITANAPNPSMVGQAVTVTYMVTVYPPGSGTIPGTDTVMVTDTTGASCAGTVAAGSCTLVPKAAGADTLTATYSGDPNFSKSTSAGVSQTVNPAVTTTKITANAPNPSVVGQAVTVTYMVTVNPPGSGTFPGTDTVTVTDTTGASCTGTVAAGSCTLAPKAAVADTLTATYSGDANFSKSTSAGLSQTVGQATTTTKITSSAPNPSVLGQGVTVSYSLTVNAPGSGTILGTDTVTVTDVTGASCTGTVAAGNCALVPKAAGADSLTATYSGDANFSKSMTSVPASLNIVPTLSVTGLSPTMVPTQSTNVGLTLSAPATIPLEGTLTLTFQSDAADPNYPNPATQFAAGGTTIDFTVPVGTTVATLPQNGAIQQGTTAGTITVTLTKLVSGTADVLLPQPVPSLTLTVPRLAPVITAGSVRITSLSSSGFNVELNAYSTPRDLTSATFTFQAANGAQLGGTTSFTVPLNAVAPGWFSSASGLQSGGSFHLTVPFTFSGDTSAIGSVSVTLSNSQGSSSPQTGGV
jgi:YVTN family beta-propeller protein